MTTKPTIVMVLPASAGMILVIILLTIYSLSAPRIRGDDPCMSSLVIFGVVCSSHPRG